MNTYDLLLAGGHLIDPSQKIDGIKDVGFKDGRVVEVSDKLAHALAKKDYTISDKIITPGSIDLHTHIYWGGTSISIEPKDYARRRGTNTMCDAGTAGAGNFAGFREHIIKPTRPRILACLKISFAGIFAFSDTVMVGEPQDERLLHSRACLNVANLNKDFLVRIKARLGARASGSMGHAPLGIALEVAEKAGFLKCAISIDLRKVLQSL